MTTPISSSAERHTQLGLTLLEILTALALLALSTISLSVFFVQGSPRMAVNSAADQLLVDLKRARLEMIRSGDAISVAFHDDGYEITPLDIERYWPNGVTAKVISPQEGVITFSRKTRLIQYKVDVSKGNFNAQINIAPITMHIIRQ